MDSVVKQHQPDDDNGAKQREACSSSYSACNDAFLSDCDLLLHGESGLRFRCVRSAVLCECGYGLVDLRTTLRVS